MEDIIIEKYTMNGEEKQVFKFTKFDSLGDKRYANISKTRGFSLVNWTIFKEEVESKFANELTLVTFHLTIVGGEGILETVIHLKP